MTRVLVADEQWPARASQGDGVAHDGLTLGEGCVLEHGVRVFHPATITLGDRVYVGHDAILKGHPHGTMRIGSGSWIGQQCYFNSAGGIEIGEGVGIGPRVTILTSEHTGLPNEHPVLLTPLRYGRVTIRDGADVGAGAILLPGTTVGRLTIVGAGAVVTSDLPDNCVAIGVPARVLRSR